MAKNPAFEAARQMIPDAGKLEKVYAIRITDKLYSGIDQMSQEAKAAMTCELRKVMARHVHLSLFIESDYL